MIVQSTSHRILERTSQKKDILVITMSEPWTELIKAVAASEELNIYFTRTFPSAREIHQEKKIDLILVDFDTVNPEIDILQNLFESQSRVVIIFSPQGRRTGMLSYSETAYKLPGDDWQLKPMGTQSVRQLIVDQLQLEKSAPKYERTPVEESAQPNDNILVVDDRWPWRELLSRALEGARLSVVTAATLDEAWEKIQTENIGMVITDLRLKDNDSEDESGFRLIEEIRKNSDRKHMPVVVITAYGGLESQRRALVEYNVQGYFHKNLATLGADSPGQLKFLKSVQSIMKETYNQTQDEQSADQLGQHPGQYSLEAEFPDILNDNNEVEVGVAKKLSLRILSQINHIPKDETLNTEIVFDLEVIAPYAEVLPSWYSSVALLIGSSSQKLDFDIVPIDKKFSFVEANLYRGNRWLCKIKFD